MSSKRYTEEFKVEAVKQITEGDYAVADVARRLGITTHSLYVWLKKYGSGAKQVEQNNQQRFFLSGDFTLLRDSSVAFKTIQRAGCYSG